MHYLHFEKGYFQYFFRYFPLKMRVMFFQKHVFQKLQKVKNVKVGADLSAVRQAAEELRGNIAHARPFARPYNPTFEKLLISLHPDVIY